MTDLTKEMQMEDVKAKFSRILGGVFDPEIKWFNQEHDELEKHIEELRKKNDELQKTNDELLNKLILDFEECRKQRAYLMDVIEKLL